MAFPDGGVLGVQRWDVHGAVVHLELGYRVYLGLGYTSLGFTSCKKRFSGLGLALTYARIGWLQAQPNNNNNLMEALDTHCKGTR